jgi:nucleoside-diphosphate-sugar epimerase
VCDNEPGTWERFQAAIVEASGKRVTTMDLPEMLVDVAALSGELATFFDKKPRLFNRQKAKMGAQEAWTCKSDALRSATGWSSKVRVPEGTRLALEWYRREKWL